MMPVRSLILAALAALVPALAAAQVCPLGIARDGVWLDFGDRTIQARVMSDGRILELEHTAGQPGVNGYIVHPIGLLAESWVMQNGRMTPEGREVMRHVGTPATLPLPVPGASFAGTETYRAGDGTEGQSTLRLTVGNPTPFAIGTCPYIGLPIDITWTGITGETIQTERLMHLPDLGVTVYQGFADPGAALVPTVPLSISLGPPGFGAGSAVSQPPAMPATPGGPPAK